MDHRRRSLVQRDISNSKNGHVNEYCSIEWTDEKNLHRSQEARAILPLLSPTVYCSASQSRRSNGTRDEVTGTLITGALAVSKLSSINCRIRSLLKF